MILYEESDISKAAKLERETAKKFTNALMTVVSISFGRKL